MAESVLKEGAPDLLEYLPGYPRIGAPHNISAIIRRLEKRVEELSTHSAGAALTPPQCCYGGRMNRMCVRRCVHAKESLWTFIDELNAAPQATPGGALSSATKQGPAVAAPVVHSSDAPITHPQGHDEAKKRIEECVREIQIIADSFGYDPYEWLADDSTPPSATQALSEEVRDLLDEARDELRCASGAIHRAPITETRIKEVIEKISAFLNKHAATAPTTKDAS